jgi:hypothetical protein
MIDEKIINELREYIKDHYVPPRVLPSILAGIVTVVPMLRKTETPPFREESNEVSEYIKEHKTSNDFAHALDQMRKEK